MTQLIIWKASTVFVMIGAAAFAQAPGDGAKFPWPENAATAPATDTAPATAPTSVAEVHGSIAIRALQGTSGGPEIGSVPVQIDLAHRGVVVNTIKTRTDTHGVVVIEDVPIAMGIQPIVRVEYSHLTYQVQAGLMDATHPHQQIDVVCYEPTEQPPAWRIEMRHVMIAQAPGGLHVTEVLVLRNPATHTWIGMPIGGSKRVTTAFNLPRGARDVTLGNGFHEWCCSTLAEGRLINHLPLMPDKTEMVYSYFVPASNGTAEIGISAPSAVDHLMVLVPETLATQSFEGLALGGTQSMGNASVRSYMASNLKPGDRTSVVLAGLTSSSNATPVDASPGGSTHMARIIAAIGGGLIILVAVVLLLSRAGAGGKATPPATA